MGWDEGTSMAPSSIIGTQSLRVSRNPDKPNAENRTDYGVASRDRPSVAEGTRFIVCGGACPVDSPTGASAKKKERADR